MKYLFEVRSGYVGESYVRVYVWTDSDDAEQAIALAKKKFVQDGAYPGSSLKATLLFTSDSLSFVSEVSDSGLRLVRTSGAL